VMEVQWPRRSFVSLLPGDASEKWRQTAVELDAMRGELVCPRCGREFSMVGWPEGIDGAIYGCCACEVEWGWEGSEGRLLIWSEPYGGHDG